MKQLLFLCSAVLLAAMASAQPGTLDPTFGNNGFVAGSGISTHYAIAQQKDGKLVTAGGYNDAEFNSIGSLARFLADGTIDSSFGVNGFVLANSPTDMLLQSDGKILIVGEIKDSVNTQVYHDCVARYQSNGIIDFSFGKNGITLIPLLENYNPYNKIRLAPDGSIIIAGDGYSDDRQRYSFLSHLSANGMFDSKFGSGSGLVINSTALTDDGLTIQKDGRILLAGISNTIFVGNYYPQAFVLSRYTPDGIPDESFGANGTVITEGIPSIEGTDRPGGIVVQPDGKIIMGGVSHSRDFGGTADMIALRYNIDGTLDNSFGAKGKSLISFDGGAALVTAVLLQQDGKLILSGGATNLTESGLALCRLNTDGTIDSSFGIDGIQITPYSSGGGDATCALLQQDGKIVQGGSYYNSEQGFQSYLLARYNNDSKGQQSIIARIKRFLHNHGIGWQGLDANINYYSVQYSKTGSGFSEKGKVSGSGSSNFQLYSFPIADAGYYRVVAVDRKGYKTFSNKVIVTEADAASSASVFPNPAQSYVTVQGLKTNETANISIKNASGNVMMQGVSGGGTQYRSSVSNLQPGTYYLDITTKDKTETLKFVKE